MPQTENKCSAPSTRRRNGSFIPTGSSRKYYYPTSCGQSPNMRADWSCAHTASGDALPPPPRWQQVIDGYQLDQAVPIRAAGQTTEHTSRSSVCETSAGDERAPETSGADSGVSGGRCGRSTDGGGCLMVRRHKGSTAGRLNKCVFTCRRSLFFSLRCEP